MNGPRERTPDEPTASLGPRTTCRIAYPYLSLILFPRAILTPQRPVRPTPGGSSLDSPPVERDGNREGQ
jgi:hypothetical protein